jgi:ABC-2 type transport system permease protein
MTGFSSLANAIRSEQMQGTLESVLLSPINIPTVIVSSSAWDFVQATFFSFLYLFFGWLFFDVRFEGNFLLALIFLLLTTLVLACIGILSASFAMVFKRGDPFGVLLGVGSALFSGVFFPTQLLGQGFGNVSRLLPPTYGLDGIRRVLIAGPCTGARAVDSPLYVSARAASLLALGLRPRRPPRQARRQPDSILILRLLPLTIRNSRVLLWRWSTR